MGVTYIFPNGPLAPTHNFQFVVNPVPPILPEAPLVIANPIAGGPHAPLWAIAYKDGNTLTVSKLAVGPETSLTLDFWIYRHRAVAASFFGG